MSWLEDCFDNVVLLATGGYLVYSGPVRDSVKRLSLEDGNLETPDFGRCCNESRRQLGCGFCGSTPVGIYKEVLKY